MSFIKKRKVRGKIYYALVEKVRRPNGTWGLKQLESYSDQLPPTHQQDPQPMVTKPKPLENKDVIRLTEKKLSMHPETNLETKIILVFCTTRNYGLGGATLV